MIATILATVVGGYILHLLMKDSHAEDAVKWIYRRIKNGVTGRKRDITND